MSLFKRMNAKRFRAESGAAFKRIYTIQGVEAVSQLYDLGFMTGFEPTEERLGDTAVDAYHWMRQKMSEKIDGFSGDWPVWAWAKRPNLRVYKRYRRGKTQDYLVTAIVKSTRIVVSDYIVWHNPLNGSPVVECEEDWNRWFSENPGKAPSSTWDKVFDLSPYTERQMGWNGSEKNRLFQLTIDRVYSNEVVGIRSV